MKNTFNSQIILDNAMKISNKVYIGKVILSKIYKDKNIQRNEDEKRINRISNEWNDLQYTLARISYHSEKDMFSVIDGNHRIEAAKKAGFTELPCVIYLNLTKEEEAEMFFTQNNNVKRVSAGEMLTAKITYGDKISKDFVKVCKKYNISINGYEENILKGQRTINSVDRSIKVIKEYGIDVFEWVIKVLDKTGLIECKSSFRGDYLAAFAKFYEMYEDNAEMITQFISYLKSIQNVVCIIQKCDENIKSDPHGGQPGLVFTCLQDKVNNFKKEEESTFSSNENKKHRTLFED